MVAFVRSALLVALASAHSIALADSVKEISQEIQTNGWFQSCSQALPRLAKLGEPSRQSGGWKSHVLTKAGCLSELRRDAEAVAYLERKYPKGDFDPDALEFLATSNIRLGNYEDAVKNLEAALTGGPNKTRVPEIHSKLALAYVQVAVKQDFTARSRSDFLKKAENSLRTAINLSDTPSPSLYTQLGQVETIKGDFEAAEKTLNTAQAVNVSYKWERPGLRPVIESEILMAKSQLKMVAGDAVGAENLAQQAMKTAPTENLKIVLEAIKSSSEAKDEATSKSTMAKSAKASILAQPYIPLDEEL